MKNLLRIVFGSALLFIMSFSFQTGQAAAKEFKDVPKKHPNYTAIQEMQQKGYITGYPDGTFRPNEPISRKHVAQLLDKALKLPAAKKQLIYKDVPLNHPYYQPIMNLTKAGIVGGSNQKFNPEASVTRVQLAKMLDVGFKLNIGDEFAGFYDVPYDHWGYLHVSALAANGVASDRVEKFYPTKPVTRAHYAEFLSRALHVKSDTSTAEKVSKEKALDLTRRLSFQIEGITVKGKELEKRFSQIRSSLLPYATQRFTDVVLKADYPYVCYACDVSFFPYDVPTIRLHTEQPDKNTLKVQTLLRDSNGPVGGGFFIHYIFKNENGIWKMHDLRYERIGKKNFELTVKEAEQLLRFDYGYGNKYVSVKFTSEKQASAFDEVTGEKYFYKQYTFIVETENDYDTVVFRTNDGYYAVQE